MPADNIDTDLPTTENPENRTLVLLRPNLGNLPEAVLPEGIVFQNYQTGDEDAWTYIWREAEPFDKIQGTEFRNAYGHDEALLAERVYFAVEESTGRKIGTVTAWSEETPSEGHPALAGWGRVHWLAVLPEFQGARIGKALFIYSLHKLREFGHQETFLVTSSGRTGAVALYQKYGFQESESSNS
jgi:ribosomal protein S18 acetylase RimI-like enzyme